MKNDITGTSISAVDTNEFQDFITNIFGDDLSHHAHYQSFQIEQVLEILEAKNLEGLQMRL